MKLDKAKYLRELKKMISLLNKKIMNRRKISHNNKSELTDIYDKYISNSNFYYDPKII